MKRPVLVYGLVGGVLIALLKGIEYRFLVIEHSLEIYGGLVALVFVSLGLWFGYKLKSGNPEVIVQEVVVQAAPAPSPFVRDETKREALGITKREVEILELISAGLSNREIAERLFVSENTVKTHSSRLFEKLNAKRRTQAVQIGKQVGLIE